MKKHRINSTRIRLMAGLRALRFWIWLIRVIGVIVPRRLRADWRQEWEAELRYRETLMAEWDKLDRRAKRALLWHSLGAFADALWLQPRRMEDEMFQDLSYGFRMLRQRPGFTLAAVIALALGIGANTAIFSVVNAVLLRTLPFADPDRLVVVWQYNQQGEYSQLSLAYPNYDELRKQCQVCEDVGAWNSYTSTRFALTGGAQPEQAQYAVVSASLFSVLGVKPALGRDFLREEDQLGAARVAIISHELWRRRWAGDPKLIGAAITLNGQSYTVVGVMPPGFVFPRFPRDAEVWVPLSGDPFPGRRFSPGTRYLNVMARLKAGATFEQAEAEMETIARRIERQDPQFNRGLGLRPTPLHLQLTGHLRPALFTLLGAVGFVLLIACANVANLLLARAASRRQEIAVRLALGATRLRLARQLLTESLMLALLGGAAGLLLAAWGVKLLSIIPYNAASYYVPYNISHDQITLDGRVLAFTFALSLLAGVIFGLAPAFQSSKPDINDALKGVGAPTSVGIAGSRRRHTRSLLVVAEVALSLTLLVGAGLMIKSFLRLQEVDPGFEPESVLTAEISLPRAKYPNGQNVAAFHDQLLGRLAATPGVAAAGLGSSLPLSGTNADTSFFIDGRPPLEPRDRPHTHPRAISPDYFRAMGMKMVEGRAFTEQDHSQAPRVAIINETMARRFWPAQPALGKRVALDYEAMKYFSDRPPEFDLAAGMREIVGVVRDVRHERLETEPQPEMYVPDRQSPEREMNLVIRAVVDPSSLAAAVRGAVSAIDPDQPVADIKPMSRLLADSVAKPRFNYLLLTFFAAVALILTITGVYGVMSYAVAQRTREMGIRLALGGRSQDVLKLVIGQGMKPVIAGVALGLAGAYALTRVMATLLFDVSATDPSVFIGVAALLATVALLACYLPARRATKIDPVIALRHD
jgi:putative ABC transport system permease protein